MDDVNGATAPAPATTPTPAAPAVAAPPVSETPVSPAPAAAPIHAASQPPAAQPPASPEAPLSPAPEKTPEASLLGAEPQKDVKAAEAEKPKDNKEGAPAEGAAPEQKQDGGQSEEPAPLPSFEAFKLPEGVTLEGERLGEFTKELAELEVLTKADHAKMQEFGQKMVDRHVAELQKTVERLNEHYVNAWEKQKTDWKESFEKDPEIGGNRAQTTINSALQFIRTHGGTEAQQQEFRELMNTTGVGNHPALIRILAKANAVLGEGKPLPGTKPVQQDKGKVARRYGATS
jgi:hypothetical protein